MSKYKIQAMLPRGSGKLFGIFEFPVVKNQMEAHFSQGELSPRRKRAGISSFTINIPMCTKKNQWCLIEN
jgi:hypothetical protein